MEKIVIYGKGGVGKSTVATNIGAVYAKNGKRVLIVGCDPKQDTSIRITGGKKARTVIDLVQSGKRDVRKEDIISKGVFGIDCIECGGPKPGVGCAGRGVSKMFEILEDMNLVNENDYDVVIFDVLGDVVCGGFAAPLKAGFGEKVFIVVSEEIMSLYAANNIMNAVNTYEYNGVFLGGIILNIRDNEADLSHVERFSRDTNSQIISKVARSRDIAEAEKSNKTVVEAAPLSDAAKEFGELAGKIAAVKKEGAEKPNVLDDVGFNKILR